MIGSLGPEHNAGWTRADLDAVFFPDGQSITHDITNRSTV